VLLDLYKILFYFEAFVHKSIILLLPTATCIARTIAMPLHVYCAIYEAPPTPHLYAMHNTILVMAILCKGQRCYPVRSSHDGQCQCVAVARLTKMLKRVGLWLFWGLGCCRTRRQSQYSDARTGATVGTGTNSQTLELAVVLARTRLFQSRLPLCTDGTKRSL